MLNKIELDAQIVAAILNKKAASLLRSAACSYRVHVKYVTTEYGYVVWFDNAGTTWLRQTRITESQPPAIWAFTSTQAARAGSAVVTWQQIAPNWRTRETFLKLEIVNRQCDRTKQIMRRLLSANSSFNP